MLGHTSTCHLQTRKINLGTWKQKKAVLQLTRGGRVEVCSCGPMGTNLWELPAAGQSPGTVTSVSLEPTVPLRM